MKKSKIAKYTKVLTVNEFRRFMKTKKIWHHGTYWIEAWHSDAPLIRRDGKLGYFPYQGFVLPKNVKLKPYGYGYGRTCFGHETVTGLSIYRLRGAFKVSFNEKNQRVYVTPFLKTRYPVGA